VPADFQILHSRIRHHFTDSGSAVVLRGTELVELRLHTQQEVKEAFTEDRTGWEIWSTFIWTYVYWRTFMLWTMLKQLFTGNNGLLLILTPN